MSNHFYIMKAHHLTSSGRKLGLKKIIRDEPNCTILVVDREHGYGKTVRAFIIGAAGDYGVKPGDSAQYTIDTGLGHKGGGSMDIVDVLTIEDGIQTEGAFDHINAYTWVMK